MGNCINFEAAPEDEAIQTALEPFRGVADKPFVNYYSTLPDELQILVRPECR